MQGWEGRNCSTRTYGYQSWCPRDCSGRGTCDRGFCHCRPGWFGLDCSKNTTYQARPQPPYSGHLKVFVYDLPSEVAFQDGYFPGEGGGPGAHGRLLPRAGLALWCHRCLVHASCDAG